ncbi:MAG: ROK family transcriptional regulator [Bacillota bacterium]|nr:ROK family transcriptional regulator [Bacillota bacterium]
MALQMTAGKNPSDIRAQNLRLLLALLVRHRQVTRVQLARATGLSKTSITNLVNECLQLGLIVETAESRRAHGRPAKYICLSSHAPQVIGVSVSRLYMTFTLARLDGEILSLHRHAIDARLSYETMLEHIRTGIAALMEATTEAVVGIGISMLGPVEPFEGVLLAPQNFMLRPTVYPIAAPLRAWAGMPVQVMHDVTAAVLAERLFNPGRSEANFGFLSLHAGVGLGLCLNHALYQGSGGFSGELGHLSIHADGIPCACGQRGCLERYANLDTMRERQHALEPLFR